MQSLLLMVLVGQMVAGIGVGILSMIVPVYNAELAPKTLRGRLVSLNQLFITAGIMTNKLTNAHLYMWLVKKGKSKKADKTLHRLRKDYTEEEIKEELNDIEFTVQNSNNSLMDVFADIFRWRILERYSN
uniref:Major facilitator superfamily (MFS) profile domain-containing protein n=1 Tax=Amphimedon queenslandica TaxID=400682 RepID=A0A1X7TVR7_AMPQE